MATGLDIGSGLSPILFALAVDPLLWMVQALPGVDMLAAYMVGAQVGDRPVTVAHLVIIAMGEFGKVARTVMARHSCVARR